MHRNVCSNRRSQTSDLRSQVFNPRSNTIFCAAVVFACWYFLLQTQPSSAEKFAEKAGRVAERAEKIAAKGTGEKAINDPKFHKQLLEIAAEYEKYSKVDDMMRWAPGLCMMPPPPKLRVSQSKDPGTHGRKLYFLYAKHRNAYVDNKKDTAGQIIVKEAWKPPTAANIKFSDDQFEGAKRMRQPTPYYKPDALGQKSGLYIMFKADSKTKDTDEGWVYGTVTPDGKTVTSSGRVESCMGCHLSAPHDRLFGLQK